MDQAARASASNTFFILAAAQGKSIAVATDYGMQTGYLVGIDEDSLVLFGPYRKGENAHWAIAILPRAHPIYIEDQTTLDDEDDEVMERYLTIAGVFVMQCKDHIRQMQSAHSEEEAS